MTAFDTAWNILKGIGSERGVKGTACPQCGAQYDPDESQWTSSVGYSTQFKQPYMCHDCDINFDGPAGTGEWKEYNPENWAVGTTEGKDFIISPAMKGKENMMDALGAFMQDRGNPGCDEAKRIFISKIPESRGKQGFINEIMSLHCDEFIQRLEAQEAFLDAEPKNWMDMPFGLTAAVREALAVYRGESE